MLNRPEEHGLCSQVSEALRPEVWPISASSRALVTVPLSPQGGSRHHAPPSAQDTWLCSAPRGESLCSGMFAALHPPSAAARGKAQSHPERGRGDGLGAPALAVLSPPADLLELSSHN